MDLTGRLTTALSDRYAIESEIDTGGMATVYRARDLKHERTVAIKVLRPDLAEAIGADRFLREIRTTANLSHPHILPLFDSGEASGLLYYVMPFVKGESLADRLEREGQLPVEDAIQVARELADALAYAHGEGVIHRDIKPANIMLEAGHALLADFGIAQARAGADETRLTGMGMSLGTPAYMSPEQISGDKEVDGRSDQYALGCVLFEMLAGRPPFEGADIQTVMRQHLAAEAPRVTGARATVRKGIAKAIHRALSKSPADRYRTAGEFEKALAGATLPLLARIPMGRARAVGLGVVVVIILGLAWAVGFRTSPTGTDPAAEAGPELDPYLVAIAPFRNLSEDPELADFGEYLALSVQDRVIRAEVASVAPFDRVVPALQAAGPDADPVAVLSRALGAGTVVTGTFSTDGDSLEIRASCLDAADGTVIHALEPIRGLHEESDRLSSLVQDRVAGALAYFRDPMVAAGEGGTPPLNPEAYEAFRRGLILQESSWEAAADQFLRAWALDSTFLDAGINAHIFLEQTTGRGPRRQELDSILALLNRQEDRMNRAQRFWFNQIRYYLEGDLQAALREARAASDMYPLEFAYTRGHTALFLNRPLEALEAFRLLETGDGGFREEYFRYWPAYFHQYAQALHRLGMHEKELEIVLEGRRRFSGGLIRQAELRARIGLGQVAEVMDLFPEFRRNVRTGSIQQYVREMFAHGMEETAREILEGEVRRFETDPFYENPLQRGIVLHFLGRDEEALSLMEEAAEAQPLEANPSTIWILGWAGIVAPLAGDMARALEIDRLLEEQAGSGAGWGFPLVRAQIHANLGNWENAVRFLEETYYREDRNSFIDDHTFFDLLQLKGYPPYDELMRPKG